MLPKKINLDLTQPIYHGSVQNLYAVPEHSDLAISETTSGGSVFDVGTIFNIAGNDTARAAFRHYAFQKLGTPQSWQALNNLPLADALRQQLTQFQQTGAATHHVGMIDPQGQVFSDTLPEILNNLTLIQKYTVLKPQLQKYLLGHFYDYAPYHHQDNFVIPLEYIVRFGVTSGSSILRKYENLDVAQKENYLQELGLSHPIKAWQAFDTPIVDFTTKYEPEDRALSPQEAAAITGIPGEQFIRSIHTALLGAYLLQHIFNQMGLFLWDLKWEIAKKGDQLVFVDTIDTDSVRVTVNVTRNNYSYFVHFNKQAMRDYYKLMHADWYAGINQAKKMAAQTAQPFTEVLQTGQQKGEYPPTPEVDPQFLAIQQQKFALIQAFIQQKTNDFKAMTTDIATQEVVYYLSTPQSEVYTQLNAVEV